MRWGIWHGFWDMGGVGDIDGVRDMDGVGNG